MNLDFINQMCALRDLSQERSPLRKVIRRGEAGADKRDDPWTRADLVHELGEVDVVIGQISEQSEKVGLGHRSSCGRVWNDATTVTSRPCMRPVAPNLQQGMR